MTEIALFPNEITQYYIFTLRANRGLYLILSSRSFSFYYGKDDTNVTSFTLMHPRRPINSIHVEFVS